MILLFDYRKKKLNLTDKMGLYILCKALNEFANFAGQHEK
ncbi:MAG: hypothetical protein JWR12_1481 [Mucilaginibacter sp.]|nr:hypothetical protein [Mucilaginibacter sp.]